MITITQDAVEHIKGLIPEEDRVEKGLRLYIEKGGCSGLSYEMKIDIQQAGDSMIESGGIKVFLDEESSKYLKGSTISYNTGLTNTGFRINNPNAKQTCGCGTSFEA
ncbi:MAG: iron-sulfur cluster assembly accessory protein [Verrucomicrobiota bacterium]